MTTELIYMEPGAECG